MQTNVLSQTDSYFLKDSLCFKKYPSTYDSDLFGSTPNIEVFLVDDVSDGYNIEYKIDNFNNKDSTSSNQLKVYFTKRRFNNFYLIAIQDVCITKNSTLRFFIPN